ncbi:MULTISPECIES: hypothetical protein [unclassified Sphingomonas]|uniref:hypothetical protein n=1 Tax=unclassified Sphingomonas TaxID=196159 RepID=UPI0006FA6859|nr:MULTISPECIES: hypothetical protein [unclassified Sphingomonas]KQM58869.1 hypothetical protein ASE65_10980 [Sphingomonas sp. Leaf16]KQN11124.1 hypothetical protein ASE81_11970 [Sphingomonas sp. Leaf29]KQN18423.1 hypothetical protein ASE83_11895 [Sphingomonas sp. Leaf32]
MPSFATATAFLSTLGVNTHAGNAGYGNASIVNNSLAYLGIKRVRDDLAIMGTASAVTNAMGAAGVKFDFVISSSLPARGDAALVAQIKAIETFAATYKGSVIAIEGLNEANIQAFSYNGSSSLAAAGAFQKALYGAVKSNAGLAGIPVINMSLGMESDADAAALGDLGKYSDFANAHAYTATGQQADKVMEASLARAKRTSTGDPVVITETGYTTLASNPDLGVNQAAQAKLTLNAMLLAFENGAQQTYLYELLDSNLQPNGAEKEKHFGLFNADGTPKLAATAVHNLTTILGYVDAGTGTDASKASYTLGGLPSDGHSMVLAKASGAWDLVVWRDVKVWNDALDKENTTEAKTITVDLGGVQKTVYVYDPLGGTKPIAVYTNVSSIQLAVGDRPLIVEVGAAGPVADLPPVSAPDLTMTAAQFAAQIDTLARSSGLKSVTLTDGKVIQLASDATKDFVVKNYGALLGKVAGGGVSFKVTETGPNWREERSFDAAGKLTSTTDFAFEGGVLKHTRTVTAAGDVTDQLYTDGKLLQVIAAGNGRTVTTSYDVATGKVAELVEKSAAGDVAVSTYKSGVLSVYTLNRADGSRDTITYDAQGRKTSDVEVTADQTWITQQFDVATGKPTRKFVQRADGSGENVTYGVTGQPYVTLRQVTNAKGAVTLVERARADGTLVSSDAVAADGTKTATTYGTTGKKLTEVIAAADGRRTTLTYDATSGKLAQSIVQSGGDTVTTTYTGGVVTQLLTVRADGSRDTITYDAQGRKTSDVAVSTTNVWTTLQYDAASGKLTRRFVQNPDGSGENVSYGITGQPYVTMRQVTNAKGAVTLVERARADGTLVSSEAVAADGAKTTTTYGTTGNKLSEIVAAADGSRTTRTWDGATGKLAQSIVQAGGDTITTAYTGGVVTQLLTVRANGSRDTITYDAQGRKTSDVEVTADKTWITQQFDAATGKLTRKFVQNADGSGENVSYGITGQPYVTMRQVTNAKGVVTLVERARADGSLVSSEVVALDGAKTTTTYGTTGNKLSEIVIGADGSRTTRTWDAITAKLVQSIVQAGGDTMTTTYTGGVVTQQLTVHGDGSRDTVSYDTQGRKTTEVTVSATKTWTTTQFDVATGNATRGFVQNADGTGENVTYGITGKSYTTQRQITDAKGKVVEVFRLHADGTLDYHERNDADGAREISNFDAIGLKLNQVNIHADGTRVSMTFTPDTQTLAQKLTQTAAGDLIDATFADGVMTAQKTLFADGRKVNEVVVAGTRQIDTFAADGKRISAVTVDSANTWTTLIYDAAGKPSRRYVERADHSGEVTVYGITGKSYVTETQVVDTAGKVVAVTRLHTDGSLDYTEANAADGSSVLTYHDTAGRKTLSASIAANGDRLTTRFDAKSGGIVDTLAETATAKVQSVYKAGKVETRVTNDLTNGSRIVESFDTQGRLTTKATTDANNNWETLRYDVASGAVSRRFIENADGSGRNFTYTGAGTNLVTEWQQYDTAKRIVAGGQTRADGTRIVGFTVAGDGTRTSEWFDAADRRQSQVTAATNGAKTSLYFDPGSQLLVKSIVQSPAGDTITASYRNGVVTDRTTQMANGATMTERFSAGGHDLSGVRALPGYQAFLFDNGSGKIAGTLADEVLLADGGGTTILTGGLGKDRFVIQRGASATITDFGAGSDLLDLSALTKGGQPTITLSEGNTVMRFGSGETVTLAGVDPSRLVASPQASSVYMLG